VADSVPDLEVAVVNVHPGKEEIIPSDHDGVLNRKFLPIATDISNMIGITKVYSVTSMLPCLIRLCKNGAKSYVTKTKPLLMLLL
jgi:hypothetical protein